MNEKLKFRILNSIVVGVLILGGVALIWKSVGWMPAVGTFLMLWGHNVEMHRKKTTNNIDQPILDIMSEILKKDKNEAKN